MLRSFDDENDKRLRNISWLKEHISEFNDADKILLLDKKHENAIKQIYDACPTEEELDREDDIHLIAARKAFEEAERHLKEFAQTDNHD